MSRAPKLLIVYDVAYPFVKGGAQRRFYEVARVLVEEGWKVDWLAFKSWDGPRSFSQDGINYFGVVEEPARFGRNGKRNGYAPLLFALGVVRHLRRLRQYELAWVGQWPLLHVLPILLYSRRRGPRVVVDWWEVWDLDTWKRYSRSLGVLGYHVAKLTLRYAARVAVLVTDTGLEARRIEAVARGRTRVRRIGNGIPWAEIGDPDQARAGDGIDLVSLGRLKDHKRVDLLIDALRIVRESHGLALRVAIVGDGPERPGLEAMARRFGLGNVEFFGSISDIRQVYAIAKRAKIGVITTLGGGAGNLSVLELYGCGLPVVAFNYDQGIDPELVEDGKTGLLISPATSAALAEGIVSLLTSPERLAGMRTHVRDRFRHVSWRNAGQAYRDLFVSTLAEAGAARK